MTDIHIYSFYISPESALSSPPLPPSSQMLLGFCFCRFILLFEDLTYGFIAYPFASSFFAQSIILSYNLIVTDLHITKCACFKSTVWWCVMLTELHRYPMICFYNFCISTQQASYSLVSTSLVTSLPLSQAPTHLFEYKLWRLVLEFPIDIKVQGVFSEMM